MNKSISVFWFRRDLRLEDNAGLFHCLKEEKNVLPLFIFDKNILDRLGNKIDKRVDFIHQVLGHLQEKLVSLDSSLLVLYGSPLEAFRSITEQFKIGSVYTNRDYEPYALKRDNEIESFLKSENIKFRTFKDQVVFEKSEVVKANGEPYTVFTPFSKSWKQKLNNSPIQTYPTEKVLR